MTNKFENLKTLKQDMKDKGWCIDSFLFNYNRQNYIVLVELYQDSEAKPKYALMKLEFIRQSDFSDNLLIPINAVKLMVDAKVLRNYFKIQYSDNLGNLLQQFTQHLASFIPTQVLDNKSDIQKKAMLASLNNSDSENPEKIYCYAVKRNPIKSNGELGQRSPYNDNKTRILRPELYQKFEQHKNLSFWYSSNSQDEKTSEEIIYNWTKNK